MVQSQPFSRLPKLLSEETAEQCVTAHNIERCLKRGLRRRSDASAANNHKEYIETTVKCRAARWFRELLGDPATSELRPARGLLAGCHLARAEGARARESEENGGITRNKEAKRQ